MNILNESISYTIENFIDYLKSVTDYDELYSAYDKMKKAKEEYNKYYKWDKDFEERFLESIEKYNSNYNNEFEILNIQKLDKFNHLKLRLETSFNHKLIKQFDRYRIYSFMYKIIMYDSLPNKMTAFTLPEIIDSKYIVFATFDEKEVKRLQAVGTYNSYDFSSPLVLIDFPTKLIYKKSNKK